jgi:hypothetical protein
MSKPHPTKIWCRTPSTFDFFHLNHGITILKNSVLPCYSLTKKTDTSKLPYHSITKILSFRNNFDSDNDLNFFKFDQLVKYIWLHNYWKFKVLEIFICCVILNATEVNNFGVSAFNDSIARRLSAPKNEHRSAYVCHHYASGQPACATM